MKLYIKVIDNKVINHPVILENLQMAFPFKTEEEILADYLPFEKTPTPPIGTYEKYEGSKYVIDGSVVKEQHIVTPLTIEEKLVLQNKVKENWASQPNAYNFVDWVFDEETCSFKEPVPYPNDGKFYRWCGAEKKWKQPPTRPNDGKEYEFDFKTWSFVEKQ